MHVSRDAPAGLDGDDVACADRGRRVVDEEVLGTVIFLRGDNVSSLLLPWPSGRGLVLGVQLEIDGCRLEIGEGKCQGDRGRTHFANMVVPLLDTNADSHCLLHPPR